MRAGLTALLLVWAGGVLAHPHCYVDQQVALTVAPDRIVMRAVIAPSTTDGAAIFDHVDLDGDGKVSAEEGQGFAASLLAATRLEVGGGTLNLTVEAVTIAPRNLIAVGAGSLDVTAKATIPEGMPPNVDFAIDYADFGAGWFVQPYYAPDLIGQYPDVTLSRSAADASIRIRTDQPAVSE